MQIDTTKSSLPIYKALASEVRLEIIQLLTDSEFNVTELAATLNLSSSIIARHIKILENAGIIQSKIIPAQSGTQKISKLCLEDIQIIFPKQRSNTYNYHQVEIPIGQYTNFQILPYCGLASTKEFIGDFDDPRYFSDSKRVNAEIIWFTQGFVEYKIPNFLESQNTLEFIDISLEIASEFPFHNNVWPSDITFFLDGIELGTWTSPGDYGDIRGKNNPDWWPADMNQYGLLKNLRIDDHHTLINGEELSTFSIHDFNTKKSFFDFRIEVKKDAKNVGGCTLFGKGFGNYSQDINFRLYYSK